MRKRRNRLKTIIAMITLVATVIETGFTSVSTYASVLNNEDATLISSDADEAVLAEDGASEEDALVEAGTEEEASPVTEIDISAPSDEEDVEPAEEAEPADEAEPAEEAAGQNESKLDVSASGISGSGYDEISIYIDTKDLDKNDKFRVKFVGVDGASYNPALNDELDKTNGGRYTFEDLGGDGFSIRATSDDDVILSYSYNESGVATITAATKSVDKALGTKILTAVDNTKISAVTGEGYDSITVKFDTEDLSDKNTFKLYVETEAEATVDGKSAANGVGGFDSSTGSVTVENLDKENFVAYVVSDTDDKEISSVASVDSVEDGVAVIKVDNVDTKRIYEFEDSRIVVTAILENPDAIPDDAYFAVTPLSDEEAERYLEALNADKGEDEELATADNTLLYDIGFYTDETKSEEIEPEDGAVSVSIEFKQEQLAEDIGAETPEDIVVTHIKEEGTQVTTETVNADASVEDGVVEFTTDSFSLYAITNIRGRILKSGETLSYRDVLMGAVLYGMTANEIELTSHVDSNMATSLLKSSTDNTTQGQYTGDKNPGDTIVADFEGAKWYAYSSNGRPFTVVTTEAAWKKFKNENWAGNVTIDTDHTKQELDGTVSALVAGTLSQSFAENSARNAAKNVAKLVNGKYVFDITGEAGGTYIIDFDLGDLDPGYAGGKYFNEASSTTIRLNSNQLIVFNIPDDKDLTLYKFNMEIADKGKRIDSATSTSEADEFCQHVVWNFYKQKHQTDLDAVLGIFLAPNGTFRFTSTSTGWVVANKLKNAGGEWHCVWQEMPEPKKTKLKIPVTKHFIDGSGEWGEEGFRFKLEKLTLDGSRVDTNFQPQYLTLNGGNSEYATAEFELPEKSSEEINWTNTDWTYGNFDKYLGEWYRISEIDQNGNTIGGSVTGKPRNDVIYNIYDAKEPLHGYPNDPYWYVHVFYYRNSRTNAMISVKRTARVVPTYNTSAGLPCIEDGTIEFVNKRIPVDVPVTLSGVKKINGRSEDIPSGKFDFTLYKYNGRNVFGEVMQTKSNVGNAVNFDPINLKYGQGTDNKDNKSYFYFLIKETRCEAPYVKDNHVFVAKVILTRNSYNNIGTSVEYYIFDDEDHVDVTKAMNGDSNFKFTATRCSVSAPFEFNNTYNAEGHAIVNGFKMLGGRDIKPTDQFTFTLTSTDDDQPAANQTKTFSSDVATSSGFNFAFDRLDYYYPDDAGQTYHYKVKETRCNDANIICDTTEYTVTVEVTDNKSGALIIKQDKGTDKSPLKFKNTYKAKGKLSFGAHKIYQTGSELAKDKEFTFRFEGGKVGGPAITPQQKSVIGEGWVDFGEIEYIKDPASQRDDTGTYKYSIREVIPEGAVQYKDDPTKRILDGIIYDARVYNITVVVTDDGNGKLQRAVTGQYDSEEVKTLGDNIVGEFTNDYEASEVKEPINGYKELRGRELKRKMFTFNLAPYDKETDLAVFRGDVVLPDKTSVMNGDPEELDTDEFRFDDITFKKVGVYKFLVTESTEDPIENIVYSTDKFIVTITVTDNKKGQLEIKKPEGKKYSMEGLSHDVPSIRFINTSYNPGEIPLFAVKDLTGKKLKKDQFQFELIQGEDVLQTVGNDENGIASFKKLSYEFKDLQGAPSKDYFYKIKEVIPEGAQTFDNGKTYKLDGYTYDGHVEDIKVTVTAKTDDQGNGYLEVGANKATDTDEHKIVFSNTYEAEGYDTFDGLKLLTGREFNEEDNGKLYAKLYEEGNDEPIQKAPITKYTKVYGEHGGAFEFQPIKYTQVGTYYYSITEGGSIPGVENDTAVYDVVVSVTDNNDGTLSATHEYFEAGKQGSPLSTITFVNEFKAENSVQFRAKKVVNGTQLEDKMFEFELRNDKGRVMETVTNDGSNVVFPEIFYYQNENQQDVDKSPFIYTINEKVKSKEGWTLSTEVYTIEVTLKLTKDGKLDVQRKNYKLINGVKTEVADTNIEFVNTYETTGKVQPFAYKVLNGRDMTEGQFSFTLYDEAGDVVSHAKTEAAKAGKTAIAMFPEITLSQNDLSIKTSHKKENGKYEKYYVIKEDIPEGAIPQEDGTYKKDGYTYDGSEYDVVVSFKDNGKGKIEADWVAYKNGKVLRTPGFWEGLWDKIVVFFGGTDKAKNALFTNDYEAAGAVKLSAKKVLTGKELKAGDFAFILSGIDENGNKFTDRKTNDALGNVEFDLIKFVDSEKYAEPVKYTYTIKEEIPENAVKDEETGIYVLDGVKYDNTEYTVVVTVADPGTGKLNVEATINGGGIITCAEAEIEGRTVSLCQPEPVDFTNEYWAKPITIYPYGEKELTGRPLKDKEFTFTMKSAGNNTKAYDESVPNIGNRFEFPEIEFTFADMWDDVNKVYVPYREFEYTVEEVKGSLAGITYDDSTFKVVVGVTNSKGVLTAKITTNDISDLANKVAWFHNTYNAEGSTSFDVEKLVKGSKDPDKDFYFTLSGNGIDTAMMTVAKNGHIASFAPIKYELSDLTAQADGTYKGVFNYQVKEVEPDGNDGYKYCQDVYDAVVTVTSKGEDAQLDVDKKIYKNGEAYDGSKLTFVNEYYAEGSVSINGIKNLVGRDLEKDEFTFILSKKDGDDYVPYMETTNAKTGEFSFDLGYTQDDIDATYYYKVDEYIPVNAPVKGLIYDQTVYYVTVTVKDNKDGTLDVNKKITDDKGNDVEECSYTNKVVEPNSVSFYAEKDLDGLALENKMFTFILEDENGKEIESVTNNGARIDFSPITYTLSDAGKVFKYTIRELEVDQNNGIEYDKRLYNAEVNVSLNDNVLDVDYDLKYKGEVISGIVFENKYRSSVDVPLGGEKRLVGFVDKVTPLGTYTFVLKDANGQVLQTREVTPQNATDPTEYDFTPLHFDQYDYEANLATGNVYRYTVEETVPVQKAANVEYAKNVYHVTVQLYKNAEGLIEANTSTDEGVNPRRGLIFKNVYKAEGTTVIDGIKTITGKDLEDGAYTFTLTGEGQDQSVTNDGSTFTFAPIAYTQKDIGEHIYVVSENAVTKDGSQYDPVSYKVKVTVAEGNNGKLDVKQSTVGVPVGAPEYTLGEGQKITFNNKFKAEGEIDLSGEKFMKNKPLKSGDFWFLLKEIKGGKEEVIQRVTCGSAPMNNKKDLTASSKFSFAPIKFTQEDLKAADGSYLKEIKRYYSVTEEHGTKGGVTYSDEEYYVEVTVANNGTDKLDVSRKIVAKNKPVTAEDESTNLIDTLKFLFKDKSSVDITFKNTYDSECIIDPPILKKQMFGKKIERGEFEFEISGPGLRSTGEEDKGYHRKVKNGLNSANNSIYYPDGKEIPVGEIYVGDIKYKYIDLDINLETGEASREFVYIATELRGENKAYDYSQQKFQLTVKAIDDGEGHMYTVPAIKDMKWVPLAEYALSDEQMSDTFLNTFNQEGSVNIVGIKKLTGRSFTKDDKFEFTLIDDKTGASVTRENTDDGSGVPRLVAFNGKDKDGNTDISFLNYRYGAYVTNPDRAEGVSANFVSVDDTGMHTYTVKEKTTDKAGLKCDTSTFKVYVDVQPAVDEKGNYVYDKNGHGMLNAKVVNVEKIYSDNNKVKFDFAGNNHFEFVNEFKATGKVEFSGAKYLNDQYGKELGLTESLKDKYGFALYQFDDADRTQGKMLVDIKTTDEAGKFTLSVPEYDQDVLKTEKGDYVQSKTLYYKIIETKPSEGSWTENNTVFESNGVVYDNTEYDVDVTVTFDGTPALKVEKTIKNAVTGEIITGISFTNIESAEYTSVSGTKTWVDNVKDASTRPDVVLNLYSSAVDNGKTIINTYTIKAPATTYEFTTDKAGEHLPTYDANGKTIKYTVEEKPIAGYLSEKKGYDFYNTKGTVKIQKIDADTKEPLVGATLAIYDGKTQIEKWTTGTSAHVVESDLTAGKTYTLREVAAPKGYDLAADMTFTVPANGGDITVTMSDKPIIGSVRLTKLDSATRNALAGAEFALYNEAGTRIYATGTAGSYTVTSSTSNGVFATSSSGILDIKKLPYGTYYFVETKAPEGYKLSTEKHAFTIADSSKVVEISFLNEEVLGAVRLRKVGETGTRSLEGAEFELYAKTPRFAGQAISSTIFPDGYYRYGTYTTNSSGEIFVDELPWDDYYFIETKAPDGYEINKDVNGDSLVYTFKVDASTAGSTISLGDITNDAIEEDTPTGVLGERVPQPVEEKVSGVLGVRSKPTSGVLGTRVGPVTGDASAIALWLTLLVACVGTIVWMLVSRKKKALDK